ncbi:ABC transporter permease [Legionella sp. D16C41]|uniref:ABC transporter permease n=1 Tax=Legionella sp. D16C41 TaxID=3402688 RepID=UPI003AF91721
MLNLSLILRTFLRDWRSGELTLLTLALIVAVTCTSTLNNFTFSVESLLNQQAAQMLGADVVVSSNLPIPQNWTAKAQELHLTETQTLSFLSMVTANDKLQLTQIKAITSPYPLKGTLKIAPQPFTPSQSVNSAPALNQVWVEAKLLSLLSINIGDKITIGDAIFTVSALLIEEPGQTGDWFNIAPRLVMNQADLAKTKVIQTGSKVTYNWLLAGNDNQLTLLKKSLNPPLTEQQNWQDKTANPAIVKAIERTVSYLNLGTVISLILAGIAISMAMHRYSQRHQQHVAILRCFGASERDIFILYLSNIFTLGFLASLIGILLGYILQPLLVTWLQGLLPNFTIELSLKPAFLSLITGLLTLLSFTFFHLLSLRQITAITLFKQHSFQANSLLNYAIAFLIIFGVSFLYIHSWRLIVIVLAGLVYFMLLALGLLIISNLLIKPFKNKLSFAWRFGFATIQRNLINSLLQLIGIGLALAAFLTLNLFKTNLIENWQQQLPSDASNFFVINIQPDQTQAFNDFLQQNQVKSALFYPIVRGRLISINNTPVAVRLGEKAKEINALQRELNFSWTNTLPEENKLVQGRWNLKHTPWLSIEEELAKQLGVSVGDTLTFRIAEQIITVPITSIRQVNWTSFKPNFFILFNPDLLADLPRTYLTSFYLPEGKQDKLLSLAKQFPNITIIDVANTIKKVQTILENISKAITLITLFSLLIGIIIVILAMLAFNDIKQKEVHILKLLGIQKKTLFWIRSSESAIIGFYAGLLAVALALFTNYYFNTVILNLTFKAPWALIVSTPIFTTFFSILINYIILIMSIKKT